MLILVIVFDWKAKWRPNICTVFCCTDWNPDRCIHVQMNIKGCIWQALKDVIRPVSRASGTVISVDNTARYASCKLGLISDYPVEESVTFKMAHSQGSLPVIRNVYYGLWSHTFVCVGVSVCFCTLTSLWAEGQSGYWKLLGSLTWTYISPFSSL